MHNFTVPLQHVQYFHLCSAIVLAEGGHSFHEVKGLSNLELSPLLQIYRLEERHYNMANAIRKWANDMDDVFVINIQYRAEVHSFYIELDSYEIFLDEKHGLVISKDGNGNQYYHYDAKEEIWSELEMLKEKE